MSSTGSNQKKPWKPILTVLALLGVVAFTVGYLLRPDFVVTWPEMNVTENGVIVTFEVANQSSQPTTRNLVVSIGERAPKKGASVSYPALDRREITVKLGPNEKKELQCDFPPQKTIPTLSWVELVK